MWGGIGYVGSFQSNSLRAWVYRSPSYPMTIDPQHVKGINTIFYPLGVGSQTNNGSQARISAFYGRDG